MVSSLNSDLDVVTPSLSWAFYLIVYVPVAIEELIVSLIDLPLSVMPFEIQLGRAEPSAKVAV